MTSNNTILVHQLFTPRCWGEYLMNNHPSTVMLKECSYQVGMHHSTKPLTITSNTVLSQLILPAGLNCPEQSLCPASEDSYNYNTLPSLTISSFEPPPFLDPFFLIS